MHVMYRKFNYRNIRLDVESIGETVGVRRRDGTAQQVSWRGFISLADAKRRRDAIPVKLVVSRVDGEDLGPEDYVQGCLTREGVLAVVDSQVVVVRQKKG